MCCLGSDSSSLKIAAGVLRSPCEEEAKEKEDKGEISKEEGRRTNKRANEEEEGIPPQRAITIHLSLA